MHLAPTFSRYLGRQFFLCFGAVFFLLGAVALVIDLVELLRRTSSKQDASFGIVLDMALLKLPNVMEHLVPFAVLFGGIVAFARLMRHREIVIVRAAGLSVWQLLMPALLIAFLIGIVKVAVFNPVAAATLGKYEQLEAKYLKGRNSLLAVSSSGVWLRQADAGGPSVVHARSVSPRGMEMYDFIIFLYDNQNRFVGRIDAKKARLDIGFWRLEDAWITGPDRPARHEDEFAVQTDLTIEKIQESFATPASVSFWELPHFITVLETAGFSGLRHRIHWNAMLADPALLCAMVLFAATFTLRMNLRRGVPLLTIAGAIGTGIILYFTSDVVFALGASSNIPVSLAAWSPAGISLLLGVSVLLYTEEG